MHDCTVHDKTHLIYSSLLSINFYLYIHAELFDNVCDRDYVVLQQPMEMDPSLDGALGGPQASSHLFFDPESLLQQHSQRLFLTTETTLEDIRP